MKAIILAAGVGKRIRRFTNNPKCLIKIKNKPLIIRTLLLLKKFNLRDVVVITGYKAGKVVETIKGYHLRVRNIENNNFREGSILSLWCALEGLRGGVLIIDADLCFEEAVLRKAMESKKKNFFLIDSKTRRDSEAVMVGFKNSRAIALKRGLTGRYDTIGEWAGFLKLSDSGTKRLNKLLKKKVSCGERDIGYEFVIPELFDKVAISYEPIDGLKWVEIDFPKDVKRAEDIFVN